MDDVKNLAILDQKSIDKLSEDVGEELIPSLFSIFLNELNKRKDNLINAFNKDESLIVQEECHAIKSSSATYGAQKLHHLARVIELQCKEGKYNEIKSIKNDFLETYNETINQVASHC